MADAGFIFFLKRRGAHLQDIFKIAIFGLSFTLKES